MTTEILSCGAGVNSTALLILAKQDKLQYDYVIFADTGGENPETYEYIEKHIKGLCWEIGAEFITVKSNNKRGEDLYSRCFRKKEFPLRVLRKCTRDFKVQPINKWIRENVKDDVALHIGFTAEEEKRIIANEKKRKFPERYPLFEWGITRADCIELIRHSNLPIPMKSGCYFCPFQPLVGYVELHYRRPVLFAKAEDLEKNSTLYPKWTITNKPLEWIRKAIKEQTSLDKFILEDDCKKSLDACAYCFR